ncbi:MAG: EAL domain-containing protein [Planctomycetes bacterium]|nr:EAL domain-containing protein [Planctomycetota bacterium]
MPVHTLRSHPQRAIRDSVLAALKGIRFHYQPIVSAVQGTILGVEALVRPAGPPFRGRAREFVAEVRRAGEARLLRAALFRSAREALERLPSHTRLFLNVARADLEDGLFLALAEEAPRVVLELDEEERPEAVRPSLQEYRRRGFRIALDDFGAGSMAWHGLATLSPDLIKLDRSMIQGLATESLRREAVSALLRLGRRTGIEVICEGVERPEERDLLLELGADLMQGFLFGVARPLTRRARGRIS